MTNKALTHRSNRQDGAEVPQEPLDFTGVAALEASEPPGRNAARRAPRVACQLLSARKSWATWPVMIARSASGVPSRLASPSIHTTRSP